jgi:hypothetical protein
VSNATGYVVKRSTTSGGPYTALAASPTGTTLTDSTVTNGTTYFYVVSATSSEHEGPNSTQASATPTAVVAPAAPSNLAATITGGNTVGLTWSDNSSNETGFRVERKVNAGSYSTLTTVGAGVTSASDATVTATNTYTYRVIATGSPDSGASNEVVAILTLPVADAYVRAGTSAALNFGTAAVTDVKFTTAAPDNQRNAFTRFSMSGVATNVVSAKLRLYGNAATTAKNTSVFSVADTTWGETTITWNNQPAMGGTALSTVNMTLTAQYREWDVTAYVQAQKTAGASLISLGIKSATDSNETQTTFNSREGTNKPVLIISSRP